MPKAPIELPDAEAKKAVASLRRYFTECLDHELGELPAKLLLAYVLEEIGPSIYNAALGDAQAWLRGHVDDLDGTLARPELPYWPRVTGGRKSR